MKTTSDGQDVRLSDRFERRERKGSLRWGSMWGKGVGFDANANHAEMRVEVRVAIVLADVLVAGGKRKM